MILSRILILNTDSLYIIRILSSLNAIRFLYQKSFLLYFARIPLTFIRYALAGWLPISTLKAMKMMTEAKFASSTICTASSYLQLFLRMKELTGNYIPFLYYFKVFNVCCIYFGMLKAVIPKFLHKAKNYVWNRVILIDLCFALLIGKKKTHTVTLWSRLHQHNSSRSDATLTVYHLWMTVHWTTSQSMFSSQLFYYWIPKTQTLVLWRSWLE